MTLMQRRRALMGAKKARLPAEYQEVEWIGGSGTQFIQTNAIIGLPTFLYCESEFECQNMISGVDYPIVWCQGANGSADHSATYKLPNVCNNKTELQGFGIDAYRESAKPFTVTNNVRTIMTFDYKINLQVITCNGASVRFTNPGPTSANNKPLRLLKSTKVSGTDAFFSGRLYHFLLALSGEKVIDAIPCYRKADLEIGMYDLVSKTFLTNAGTGDFTKGADVK